MTQNKLKKEIQSIKERNARVEADKAWETSWARRIMLAVLTYIVVLLFFLVAQLPNPFVNSLVPTLGFLISTLTIDFAKKEWIKKLKKK
ncbi:MAG: hypothetical protein WCW44_05960 [archaeon]|jgi:polyferredoxin